MKPSRENVFAVMARLEQSGSLPDNGPTSIFVSDSDGRIRRHATQLAVRVSGDAVFVRISRMPFVKPYVYSRQALKAARL
ncbi:MAG: hypothetical protein ACI4MM_00130 [Candidatus Ventricola sp.]